jgi:hypothetical protein
MNKYRVLINGKNLLFDVDGDRQKMGFYVTRFVEAETYAQAEQAALNLINQSDKLRGMLNSPADPPVFDVEEIDEVDSLADNKIGFAFYREQQ